MNATDRHYCIRKWNGRVASVWVLDDAYTYIDCCAGAMTRDGKRMIVFPKSGDSFIMSFEAFVPVSRVRCLWDSQVNAIIRDAQDNKLALLGNLRESVESEKRRLKAQ